jgi:hypothetical protein
MDKNRLYDQNIDGGPKKIGFGDTASLGIISNCKMMVVVILLSWNEEFLEQYNVFSCSGNKPH